MAKTSEKKSKERGREGKAGSEPIEAESGAGIYNFWPYQDDKARKNDYI